MGTPHAGLVNEYTDGTANEFVPPVGGNAILDLSQLTEALGDQPWGHLAI